MNTKKQVLAFVAAFVLSNVLTTIWYIITDEANYVDYRRGEMNYLGMLLNHVVYVGIFVHIFPYFFKEGPTLIRGFWFGILMGAMMFLPSAMVIRSIWRVDFNTIFILNSIAHLVIGGIMGVVVAIIFNYRRK